MSDKNSYTFKLKRGHVYLNYICSPHGEHNNMWMVSRSTHKRKDYFKSQRAAELFIEINFYIQDVKSGGKECDLTKTRDRASRIDGRRDIAKRLPLDKYSSIPDTSSVQIASKTGGEE